jgi:DNA-binding response OmpR family regulator
MSKKVLVVDDEDAIVEVVRAVLKKEGYEVYTALGGIPCIELLREVNPDILIMDVMMPDMDGWEVLRILKGRGVLEHTKVLMLTVVEEPKEEDTDLSPYIIDYITKPFDRANLIERVNFVSSL